MIVGLYLHNHTQRGNYKNILYTVQGKSKKFKYKILTLISKETNISIQSND